MGRSRSLGGSVVLAMVPKEARTRAAMVDRLHEAMDVRPSLGPRPSIIQPRESPKVLPVKRASPVVNRARVLLVKGASRAMVADSMASMANTVRRRVPREPRAPKVPRARLKDAITFLPSTVFAA